MKEEVTLEMYRLVIGKDEVEAEAQDRVSEYLMERAAIYGNRLGIGRKKVKEFDIVKDPMSEGWVLVFMCERYF
jgi:hypothetical protein